LGGDWYDSGKDKRQRKPHPHHVKHADLLGKFALLRYKMLSRYVQHAFGPRQIVEPRGDRVGARQKTGFKRPTREP
jgi:hypothetical protein